MYCLPEFAYRVGRYTERINWEQRCQVREIAIKRHVTCRDCGLQRRVPYSAFSTD